MDWSKVAPAAFEAFHLSWGHRDQSWELAGESARNAWMAASRAAVEEYERQRTSDPVAPDTSGAPAKLGHDDVSLLMDRIDVAIEEAAVVGSTLGYKYGLSPQHPLILIRDLAKAVLGSTKAAP